MTPRKARQIKKNDGAGSTYANSCCVSVRRNDVMINKLCAQTSNYYYPFLSKTKIFCVLLNYRIKFQKCVVNFRKHENVEQESALQCGYGHSTIVIRRIALGLKIIFAKPFLGTWLDFDNHQSHQHESKAV